MTKKCKNRDDRKCIYTRVLRSKRVAINQHDLLNKLYLIPHSIKLVVKSKIEMTVPIMPFDSNSP